MIQSQRTKDVLCIDAAVYTNGNTAAVNIDTLGADYATIRVALGRAATGTIASADGTTVKLTESADTNASNATTFVADKTAIKVSQEVLYHVDTRSRKRYLRLSIIPGTSGVSNEIVTCAAFATLGRLEAAPTSTSGMVNTTNDQVVIT